MSRACWQHPPNSPVSLAGGRPLTLPAFPHVVSQKDFSCWMFLCFLNLLILVVGMNTGLNLSCRFFQGFIHRYTISPLTDHTRQKTSDTWFVAGLTIQTIDWNRPKTLNFSFQYWVDKETQPYCLFSFFGFNERPSKHNRLPFVIHISSWRFIALLFSAIQRLYFYC